MVIHRRDENVDLVPEGPGGDDSEMICVCYRSLAMGDQKAVALAQEAHLALLESAGLDREKFLLY